MKIADKNIFNEHYRNGGDIFPKIKFQILVFADINNFSTHPYMCSITFTV